MYVTYFKSTGNYKAIIVYKGHNGSGNSIVLNYPGSMMQHTASKCSIPAIILNDFLNRFNVLIQGLYFLISSRDTKPLALGIGCNRQGKETCFRLLHENCLPCDFNRANIIIIEDRESDTYTPCKRVLTSDQSSFPSFQNC